MVTIIFEAHSTTHDNEHEIASGWRDATLSPTGISQAEELGERYAQMRLHAVYTSDLSRSFTTAEIAFSQRPDILIIRDQRLRECNYGIYNGKPADEVARLKSAHLHHPFPKGESYDDCMERMQSFLADIRETCEGKKILIIGHRATQYGLDHWIHGRTLEACVGEHFVWQPGWTYTLR